MVLELILGVSGILLVLVGGFYYWRVVLGSFNTDVIIFLDRGGNNSVIGFDKGKRVINKKTNEIFYSLKKAKMNINPPDYRAVYISEKGKPVLLLNSPTAGHFTPAIIKSGTISPMDADIRFWTAVEVEKEQLRYQNKGWFEKYAWLAAVAIILTVSSIMLYVSYEGQAKVAASNAGVTAEIGKLIRQVNIMRGGGSLPDTPEPVQPAPQESQIFPPPF